MSHKGSPPSQSSYKPDFRADITSGFMVFLIALPLCLGIAMASGFPPVAGILTAVVGGLVATFLGSAQLTIKGPAAGLIVIALGAVQELGNGDMATGYRQALATIFIAGVIQMALALVRAGKFGAFFPAAVVHGMLAAIGVIIISKQAHVLMGVAPQAKEPLHLLAEIPHSLATMNPAIFGIGALSLLLLFGLPLVPKVRKVPAPLLVLLTAVPLGVWIGLDHTHAVSLLGDSYEVGPKYLVQLPGNLLQAITFPDFSAVTSGTSIKYIVMFTLVGSIESLLSAKAVDMLDPQRRHSDLDKDLLATGVGNTIAGLIGGLPMISEIVRSSANINNGAQSRWSNFFHGVFLLVFVALMPGLLQMIPLAALSAMLIYTGVRLASPREFVKTFRIGPEQLLIFTTTLLVTLATDLLVGVASGVVLKIILHLVNGAPVRNLFRAEIEQEKHGQAVIVRVHGAAVFTNYLGLEKKLTEIDAAIQRVVLDLDNTRLIDHTTVEKLHHLVEDWQRAGRELVLQGLDEHRRFSKHHLAARRKALASQT